jgi:hypothetical protein
MLDMEELNQALMRVKQEVFNEMVEGNGRQPAEVVDTVCYALQDLGLDCRSALDFYPDYTE